MDRLRIRRMAPTDLDAAYQLELECFSQPWSGADLSSEINGNPVARYLVLEHAGEVLGFAGMHVVLDEGHIVQVAVAPAHRGKGYGTKLAMALMQYAANLGVSYVTLEVRVSNEPARRLYAAMGFQQVSVRKRYYEDTGEDGLLMVCDQLPASEPGFREAETSEE